MTRRESREKGFGLGLPLAFSKSRGKVMLDCAGRAVLPPAGEPAAAAVMPHKLKLFCSEDKACVLKADGFEQVAVQGASLSRENMEQSRSVIATLAKLQYKPPFWLSKLSRLSQKALYVSTGNTLGHCHC
jgi:hypothetical protein